MDKDTLRFIQDNVPSASEEIIQDTFYKYEQNVLDTISFLLEIPKPEKKPLSEWEERREIFDSYDYEMQKLLKEMKTMSASPSKPTTIEEVDTNKKIQVNPAFFKK